MKPSEEVISEFNEYVNMTADELEKWLKSGDSNSAGWPKDDAEGDGETVGHDSGRKIVEILRENPDKDADKYTEEQVEHMRKVVAYCKRHLAQEAKGNSEKSEEEVKKTKSYASLKNWGHDFLKAQGETKGADKEEATEKEEEKEDAEGEDDSAKTGDKRKKTGDENGSSKKRETRQGEGAATKDDKEDKAEAKNGDDKEEAEEEEVSEEDPDEDDGDGDVNKGPKKGDTVSWKWGNGNPEGKVLDVKGEK
ncbi:DNA-binding protein [Plectosphaerella plurivora]|uniref:DNA-binding protein n=1 Tax=Plectosphaerella plurivora TaxID=936078 RepID=A0A9P9ADI6_9PEZI|nr:DNA-binding protein [Plectosphaerella plurivora]